MNERMAKESFMKCPICLDATLVLVEPRDVAIDHCPQCRGMWLDGAELEQLIERSATPASNPGRNHATKFRPDFVDSDHHRAPDHYVRRKKYSRGDIHE
jgi:hypothetical protein